MTFFKKQEYNETASTYLYESMLILFGIMRFVQSLHSSTKEL